jgi:hypothetical protein
VTSSQRFLAAITLVNLGCAAVSIASLQPARAASEVAPVLRGRMLEIVDEGGRVRSSIKVQADGVVLRLVNPDGMPGVKLASGPDTVGLAMIAREGDYIQVFSDGVKLTKEGRRRAAWP